MHPKKCPSHLRLWWPCRVLSQIHSRRPPCWGEQDVPPDWRNKTTVMLRNLPNKCPGFFWERSSYHPPLTHLFPSEIRPCEGLVKGHQGLISFDKALGPWGRDVKGVKGEGGWLAIKWNWTSLKCPGMFRHSFLWVQLRQCHQNLGSSKAWKTYDSLRKFGRTLQLVQWTEKTSDLNYLSDFSLEEFWDFSILCSLFFSIPSGHLGLRQGTASRCFWRNSIRVDLEGHVLD